MDNLNQFGALVTNGQEELASLSYLVAMEFALENADKTQKIGKYYRSRADELAAAFPDVIGKIEGIGHLLAIHFKDAKDAARFAKILNDACIDVSEGVQSAFLPAVLTKLPLAVTMKAVDFITDKMRSVLMEL
jgi:4-aminobutyrate aminotransferase-like enzyme